MHAETKTQTPSSPRGLPLSYPLISHDLTNAGFWRLQLTTPALTEWSDGYGPRFGVTFTDYDTLERTPKKSAMVLKHMFAERQGVEVAG